MSNAFLALALFGAVGLALSYVPTRTVGGLTFWRIGRLGGSFYVTRERNNTCGR
jgi:hypothetical protein